MQAEKRKNNTRKPKITKKKKARGRGGERIFFVIGLMRALERNFLKEGKSSELGTKNFRAHIKLMKKKRKPIRRGKEQNLLKEKRRELILSGKKKG